MTKTAAFDVDVLCDEGCFDLPEWRTLLGRDPNRHVFATPEWNRLWWDEFGSDKDLFLMTMRRGDRLVAIVPLYRERDGDALVLRFIGGVDLTDYLGPICSEDDRDEVAEALTGWLDTTEVEWDQFDAHNMPVPFGFAEFLVDWADRRSLPFTLELEEMSAVLRLPRDWDAYLAGLESKDRHELKRKRRRLQRDYPDARVRTTTREGFDQDFGAFVDMHRGAEGLKADFMRADIVTFFERIGREFMDLGWLRLDLLEVAGRPVASTFGFSLDRRFYLYNSAYEPDAARMSPGLVLVSESVKRSIHEGFERFDFLRGPERYKYELGAEALPLHNVRIRRSTAAPGPGIAS